MTPYDGQLRNVRDRSVTTFHNLDVIEDVG